MKKFLVVLTLVLVAGFAFAAVSGTIEARYTFDFTNAKTLEYDIWGTHSKVSFTVSTEQAKVDGSNKPYATVTVDVELGVEFSAQDEQILGYSGYEFAEDVTAFKFGVVLSDFRIVGENWEIDFLKAVAAGDYAKSAWEVDNTAKAADRKALDAPWAFGKSKGITVTYDGYKIGVSAERRADTLKADIKLRAESKDLTLAEGVTGKAAFGLGATKVGDADMTFDFGASLKAAYATDDVAVDGAVDVQYVNEKFDADVAVKVAVKPVTVDAYYATRLQKPRLHSLLVDENILSVRVIVDLDPVKVTVYGEDLINNDRFFAVKEEGKFGALSEDAQFGIYPSINEKFEIDDFVVFAVKNIWFANAGIGYDVMENLTVSAHAGYSRANGIFLNEDVKDSSLAFKVGAEYKFDIATVSADLCFGKEFGKYGDVNFDEDFVFGCDLTASSEKLVENAVLSATLHIDKDGAFGLYNSTLVDYYKGDANATGDGNYFEISCKVAF